MKSRAQRLSKVYPNKERANELLEKYRDELREQYLAQIEYRVKREIDRIETAAMKMRGVKRDPYGILCAIDEEFIPLVVHLPGMDVEI